MQSLASSKRGVFFIKKRQRLLVQELEQGLDLSTLWLSVILLQYHRIGDNTSKFKTKVQHIYSTLARSLYSKVSMLLSCFYDYTLTKTPIYVYWFCRTWLIEYWPLFLMTKVDCLTTVRFFFFFEWLWFPSHIFLVLYSFYSMFLSFDDN